MRRERRPRKCAIVASQARWAPEAARVLRAHGYAVANLPDLDYADLLVGPGELRLILLGGNEFGPAATAHIALLRRHNADLVLVVVGVRPGAADTRLEGDRPLYLSSFDDQELLRILEAARARSAR